MFNKSKVRILELESELKEAYSRIDDLKEKLSLSNKIKELGGDIAMFSGSSVRSDSLTAELAHKGYPRVIDDYFGGKVLDFEAHDVTILDVDGKATYAKTKQAPKDKRNYTLVQL